MNARQVKVFGLCCLVSVCFALTTAGRSSSFRSKKRRSGKSHGKTVLQQRSSVTNLAKENARESTVVRNSGDHRTVVKSKLRADGKSSLGGDMLSAKTEATKKTNFKQRFTSNTEVTHEKPSSKTHNAWNSFASQCGECVWEDCPSIRAMDRHCPAGMVRDDCNCCVECAAGLRQPCLLHGFTGSSSMQCGRDLECVRSSPGAVNFNEGECECTMNTAVCADDNTTFENICEFREVASRTQQLQAKVLRHEGPCKSVPILINHPTNIAVEEGGVASFRCEVNGFPVPTVQWLRRPLKHRSPTDKEVEEELPGYHPNVVTQIRGGPGKYQLTTWLTVDGAALTDSGSYICRASNAFGTAEAKPVLSVLDRSDDSLL